MNSSLLPYFQWGKLTMKTQLKPLSLAIILMSQPAFATELKTININADLRETNEQEMPTSISVKTQKELQDEGASHFDDVLLKTPNVNYSGQSSRARHIQIRGIGERDEYTGAPNSSVGFAIDDIDYSGIGMAASTFDIQQIEVLRGPQNTRYGQSAIAGLINVKSNEPTEYRESMIEATAGQDSLTELGIMTSGPFSSAEKSPQYRIAIFKHDSDGFRDNKTLNRSDTNGRDELTARAKLRFFPSDDTTVDVTLLHADLDNGYDAWSRDNSFTNLSNEPGQDTLLSNAFSAKVTHQLNSNRTLQSITSFSDNELRYAYDTDWKANDTTYRGLFDNQQDRQNFSQDIRVIGKNWLIGAYFSKMDEKNTRYERYDYPSWGDNYQTDANSDYVLKKASIYGQYDLAFSEKATVALSARLERNWKDFDLNTQLSGFDTSYGGGAYDYSNPESSSPTENLWGGSIIYSYKYNQKHTAFTGVTRGYKMGGFNTNLTESSIESGAYDSETLYNYEIGLKSNYLDGNLKTSTNLFYMDRKNPQFDGYGYESSYAHWVYFTENFESANAYGLEAEFDWRLNTTWNLFGAVSVMKTDISGTPTFANFTLDDREYAHAPSYQYNFGAKYRSASGLYLMADINGMDAFYFDNVHDFKSDSYTLVNARIGYEQENYEVYLWGKNITDETYATRGFQFDHFDGDGEQQYVRLGDPRQIGVTARIYF